MYGEEAVTANEHQVGGLHYAADIQHWDWVEANGMGYLEGCATKYATRNRKKHSSPTTDIRKSIHYVDKLIELHLAGGWKSWPVIRWFTLKPARRRNRIRHIVISAEAFILANRLTAHEAKVIEGLTHWKTKHDLWYVRMFLVEMLADSEKGDRQLRHGAQGTGAAPQF